MNQRNQLEQRAKTLQSYLYDLEHRSVNESQRPIREVGINAIRESLLQVGRELSRYPYKQKR